MAQELCKQGLILRCRRPLDFDACAGWKSSGRRAAEQPPPERRSAASSLLAKAERRAVARRRWPWRRRTLALDDPCGICLEALQQPDRLACGHHFCRGCVERWLEVSDACPLCRRLAKPFSGRRASRALRRVWRHYALHIELSAVLLLFFCNVWLTFATTGLRRWVYGLVSLVMAFVMGHAVAVALLVRRFLMGR